MTTRAEGTGHVPGLIYAPIAIYRNLLGAFFRYRGLRHVGRDGGPPGAPLSDDDIVGELEQFAYLRVDAVRVRPRGIRDRVVFLVLARDGKYAAHSPDLKQLIKQAARTSKEDRIDEITVIADDVFFTRKNMTDVITDRQKQEAVGDDGDAAGVSAFTNAYAYHIFTTVVPEHVAIYPHRIMAPAEVAALFARERNARGDYPVAYDFDPPTIWAGGRPGQMVEILRDSPIAVRSIAYRRIERGSLSTTAAPAAVGL